MLWCSPLNCHPQCRQSTVPTPSAVSLLPTHLMRQQTWAKYPGPWAPCETPTGSRFLTAARPVPSCHSRLSDPVTGKLPLCNSALQINTRTFKKILKILNTANDMLTGHWISSVLFHVKPCTWTLGCSGLSCHWNTHPSIHIRAPALNPSHTSCQLGGNARRQRTKVPTTHAGLLAPGFTPEQQMYHIPVCVCQFAFLILSDTF